MAWDLVVRTFYTDSGLAAGLARANEGLRGLARSGPQAGQGVRAVEQGVRTLAFQAVGLPGPLGRIASGLLQLGGGNALMLGAVAGIAAVGFVIKAITRDAHEAAEGIKKMTAELDTLGEHGKALSARIKIGQLERRRDEPTLLENIGDVFSDFVSDMTGGGGRTGRREELERNLAELRGQAGRAGAQIPGLDEARKAAQARDEARIRFQAGAARAGGTFFEGGIQRVESDLETEGRLLDLRLQKYERIPPAIRAVIEAREHERALLTLQATAFQELADKQDEARIRSSMLGASEDAVTEALRTQQLVVRGWAVEAARALAQSERFNTAQIKTAQVLRQQLPAAFAAMGQAAATSMQAVVQSALQSVAQIAQSLPGVTPAAGGVIGFVGGLLGGLFNRNRPMPVEVTNAEDLRPEGPDRFTLQIIGAATGELLEEITYELGRRTRLDRVVRIPRRVTVS